MKCICRPTGSRKSLPNPPPASHPPPASDPAPPVSASLLPAPKIFDPEQEFKRTDETNPSEQSDEDSDSSDDSFLSFDDTDDEDVPGAAKDEERKRRENERQRVIAAAGLKVRRDPPGVPTRRQPPPPRKRRAPPAAPASKRDSTAPSPLPSPEDALLSTAAVQVEDSPQEQTQDAYDRYENFLEQAKKRPARSRADSYQRPLSTATIGSLESSGLASPSASAREASTSTGGKLTGFLSKLIAPAPVERKIPAISGPISATPMIANSTSPSDDNAEDRPDSPSFGQTWSSLVDPSVLATMSVKEKKRQEAIFEFISTESAYVRDLQLIVEVFYASMLNMLDDKALTVIFANVEDMLLFNTGFLSSLEERQKSSRLYINTIGDIFEQHISSISVYLPYCVNQAQAIRLLQSLRQADPSLAQHLQTIRDNEPAVRNLDLSSFLLQPMQRLTRYPLLLRQIIHYTEPDQDLKQVGKALLTAEGIVANVNESVREAEGLERLRILSEDLWIGGEGRLDLTAPTALQGPRRLLKEGLVLKAKSGRKLQLVLCNDIVVLIESRNLYRMPMPLHEVVSRAARDETGFQLKLEYSKGSDVIALKASSAREAQAWVSAIEAARAKSIDARKRHANRRSRASSLGHEF